MKNTLIIVISLLLGLCGCTQYNGHIGPIFGSWSLIEISEDGVALKMKEETTFSFQNQIVEVIKREDSSFSTTYRYGNFEKTDNLLILKFQTSPTSTGNTAYMTPDWIYLPLDETSIPMDIKELNGKKMELVLTSGPKTLQYTFVRTW
ncbi:MAG: lipocalin-like domain-containing protein [Muribaculaceae bacterium]|nr:lipocalin-like domain-containing protein [Muribaculaceae bacterium]